MACPLLLVEQVEFALYSLIINCGTLWSL